jgi:tetratricopeptide (TPR) repeat protein
VWIDERGKVVRPGEPAWTTSRTSTFGGKNLVTEGEAYVAAIRDWVAKGERSEFALSDEQFAARVKRRTDKEMEADASFALAVHFYDAKDLASAKKYFERAQALNPDDWNYHRQDWSFGGEAGAKWMEKFQKLEEPYYPKLELKPKPKG